MPDPRRHARAALRFGWVGPLACACFAFLTHTLPFTSRVFRPFGLVLYGDGDVYYHLRRIRAIADQWPRVPDFDAYMNYPHGAYSIWAPGFDFVPATLAQLGMPLESVAVHWPPLLSALTCLPFYSYARRRFGTAAAVGGSVLLALLPATVLIGALGRIDHHVAELLFQMLIYAQLQRCCDAYEGNTAARADWLWLGLTMAGALLTWAGSLLFLCVPAALGIALNLLAPGPTTQRITRLLLRAFLLAGLLALPYGVLNSMRGRDPFSPNFPSLLQTIGCVLMSLLVYATAKARERSARWLLPAAAPIALFAIPAVRRGLVQGLAFLSRDQADWLTTISEFRPLLSSSDMFQYGAASVGYALFLVPVLIVWHASRLVRERHRHIRARDLLLLGWGSHVFVLALLQIRFLHYAAPVIALVPWWLAELARPHLQRRAATLTVLPVLLLWPTAAYWAPVLHGGLPSYPQYRGDLFELLHNMPQRLPPVDDPTRASDKPSYCVFAEWDLGHAIVEIAKRPVVANNFGTHLEGTSYLESSAFFTAVMDEASALEIVERRGCRYVLTPARSPLLAASSRPHFARRVHDGDGSDGEAGTGSGRLRLVLETLGPPVAGQAAYKLFELVRGALVKISATSDTLWLETHIRSSTRDFWYRRKLTRSTPGAPLEARIAYPGSYRLVQAGEAVFSLELTNEAVTSGKTISLAEHGPEAH